MSEAKPEIHEDHILIEFVHRPFKATILSRFFKHRLVQGEPFKMDFQFTNRGNEPSKPFKVTDIGIKDVEGKTGLMSENTLQIKTLNPGETTVIEADTFTSWFEGRVILTFRVQFDKESHKVVTYVKDRLTNIISPSRQDPEWIDFIVFQRKIEILQARTNMWLLLITSIALLETIYGVKNLLQGAALILSKGFSFLAAAFSSLG